MAARPALLLLGSLLLTALSAPAAAEPPAVAVGQPAADGIRRDPVGLKGVSPMVEAVAQGDAAFIARDFPPALTAYTDAVKADPKHPLGHLRLAQLHYSQGRLSEAEQSIVSALRFVGPRGVYRAQAFFLLALVREAQRSFDDAVDSWAAYEALGPSLAAEAPPAAQSPEEAARAPQPPRVYTATASSRRAMLEARKKAEADAVLVKQRVDKELAAAQAAATGGAK
jgi:tetratricopeptide (TPR) repeat protein